MSSDTPPHRSTCSPNRSVSHSSVNVVSMTPTFVEPRPFAIARAIRFAFPVASWWTARSAGTPEPRTKVSPAAPPAALRVPLGLDLVGDQHHHAPRGGHGLGDRLDVQPVLLRRGPRLAVPPRGDDDLDPAVVEVQRLRAALDPVADDRDGLALQRTEVRVLLVIQLRHRNPTVPGPRTPSRRLHRPPSPPRRRPPGRGPRRTSCRWRCGGARTPPRC